jgi:hypothetical protein
LKVPGEQWTMFFCDPFGNPLEIKGSHPGICVFPKSSHHGMIESVRLVTRRCVTWPNQPLKFSAVTTSTIKLPGFYKINPTDIPQDSVNQKSVIHARQ